MQRPCSMSLSPGYRRESISSRDGLTSGGKIVLLYHWARELSRQLTRCTKQCAYLIETILSSMPEEILLGLYPSLGTRTEIVLGSTIEKTTDSCVTSSCNFRRPAKMVQGVAMVLIGTVLRKKQREGVTRTLICPRWDKIRCKAHTKVCIPESNHDNPTFSSVQPTSNS